MCNDIIRRLIIRNFVNHWRSTSAHYKVLMYEYKKSCPEDNLRQTLDPWNNSRNKRRETKQKIVLLDELVRLLHYFLATSPKPCGIFPLSLPSDCTETHCTQPDFTQRITEWVLECGIISAVHAVDSDMTNGQRRKKGWHALKIINNIPISNRII